MKKLFSYLLISSMVVLSSCTNYDDQFDDLNTQINSLKSQIEGFSSLSSGLSSLQGTVSALQSAVASLPQTATPATDISGLEAAVAELQAALAGAATNAQVAAITADLAATQAALEASIAAASTPATDLSGLEASVAALETALAAASTSEEVSSISTELAAAQAALAAAIEANATASADNATDIAALATSLDELAATIAELQATLAGVSTAEEVSALADALTAAQADLTAIIASSSFYEADLDITNQTELDFAVSLGDKVKFLSKDLTITQTDTMDATQLAAVMAKIRNVNGAVIYTSTATDTAKATFVNLTGTGGDLTFSQDGDISLPKLESVGGSMSITGSLNSEVVSLPALTKVVTSMTFTTLNDVTTFSMPVMVNHDAAITINIDNDGTVDLSAFTNATAQDGTTGGGEDLTVNAAVLTAPVYAKGKITADRLDSVDLPKWQMAAGSSFDRASTVVLPSVAPTYTSAVLTTGYNIAIQDVFNVATSVHFIAAPAVAASSPVHMSVSSTSTKLETLILGGTYNTINISGSDVTSITFDGTAKSVTVNATDVEVLDLPYTSAAKGTLAVTANTKLTSLSADNVNGLSNFTLTGNSDLTDISFDALVAASATGASVSISGNDLAIESVTDGSAVAPIVTKKIVSADFSVLKAFLTSAISKVGTTTQQVNVSTDLDDVSSAFTSAGVERDPATGDEVLAAYSYVEFTTNAVDAVSKEEEMYISNLAANSTFKVDDEIVSIIGDTGLTNYYDIAAWANSAATAAQLEAVGVEITEVGKGQKTATFDFADASTAILTNVSAVVDFTAGVDTISVTTGSASTTAEVAAAIEAALDLGDGVISQYYSVERSGNDLTFSSNAKGSDRQTFALAMSAKVLSGTVGATSITFATTSTVKDNSVESTDGAYIRFKSIVAGTDGAKTITVVGPSTLSAVLLTASGISTAHAGDDEYYVAAVESEPNTIANNAAITAAKKDNVQYLVD